MAVRLGRVRTLPLYPSTISPSFSFGDLLSQLSRLLGWTGDALAGCGPAGTGASASGTSQLGRRATALPLPVPELSQGVKIRVKPEFERMLSAAYASASDAQSGE